MWFGSGVWWRHIWFIWTGVRYRAGMLYLQITFRMHIGQIKDILGYKHG